MLEHEPGAHDGFQCLTKRYSLAKVCLYSELQPDKIGQIVHIPIYIYIRICIYIHTHTHTHTHTQILILQKFGD